LCFDSWANFAQAGLELKILLLKILPPKKLELKACTTTPNRNGTFHGAKYSNSIQRERRLLSHIKPVQFGGVQRIYLSLTYQSLWMFQSAGHFPHMVTKADSLVFSLAPAFSKFPVLCILLSREGKEKMEDTHG
jgi:hypothetical protein